MKYKDQKEKRYTKKGNGQYITTSKDIKIFTKQVETEEFADKKFEKAYSKFKKSAYQSGKGGVDNAE